MYLQYIILSLLVVTFLIFRSKEVTLGISESVARYYVVTDFLLYNSDIVGY